MQSNSDGTKQQQEASATGRVAMQLHVPEFQKGAIRLEGFIFNRVTIRKALFTLGSTSNLENYNQDDTLFARR